MLKEQEIIAKRDRINNQLISVKQLNPDESYEIEGQPHTNIVSQLKAELEILNDIINGSEDGVKRITFTMYGASDDLIELKGDIYDEVGARFDTQTKFVCSDGTTGDIEYGSEGVWRIHVNPAIGTKVDMVKGISEDIDPKSDYTDKATITGNIKWILFDGGSLISAK